MVSQQDVCVAQKAETNEGRSASREQNKKRGREHVRLDFCAWMQCGLVALNVHCSLYAVCEPLHLPEWYAGASAEWYAGEHPAEWCAGAAAEQ